MQRNKTKNSHSYGQCSSSAEGFIAITSVSFLSAFFLILFVGMFFSATEALERTLDREISVKALSMANSCMEVGLNELRKNVDYIGGEMKSIDGDVCEIKEVESYGLYGKVIKTEAEIGGQTKKVQVEVDTENWADLKIIGWREVGDFDTFESE